MKTKSTKRPELRIDHTVFPDGVVCKPYKGEQTKTSILALVLLIMFIFTLLILGTMIFYSMQTLKV